MMANVDCNSDMTGFHSSEVTLSSDQQKDMRKNRDAGRTRLENGLALKSHPKPVLIESQGSYQMRTMVQDAENDYDIDDGAYFSKDDLVDSDKNPLTPKASRERICEALKWDGRLKHDAEVKRNCVRQLYPAGHHIDIPVYRVTTTTENDEKTELYELASGDAWVESDARAVTRWFNNLVGELNAGESDGSQMRRITKLTKKMARSRKDWKEKTTSGICISKLVVDNFVHSDGRDDLALRETWKSIKKSLDTSTQIKHPVLDTNLAEIGDSKVTFFHTCVKSSLKTLEALDGANCDRRQARLAWDEVFNTSYFSSLKDNGSDNDGGGNSGNSKKIASVILTSMDVARRNDGGGRFG